jgi:hypothetical protein
METVARPDVTIVENQNSDVSWSAIAAGAVAACAVTLLLMALGAGIGFSMVSPWADAGVSATTFKVSTGIYLCCVAVIASAIGGYLAARLRTRWIGFHTNEVFFRDTAHGFVAWAFATLLTASVLSAATTSIVGGIATGAGQAAQNINGSDLYVDRLFRPDGTATAAAGAPPGATAAMPAPANSDTNRAEVLRLWTAGFRDNRDLSAADRAYVARLVAGRTGISQAEAEKRVNEIANEAKAATDRARRTAAQFSFWLTASLLLGAFAASFAAVEGGMLRDGTWNGRVLTPRAI